MPRPFEPGRSAETRAQFRQPRDWLVGEHTPHQARASCDARSSSVAGHVRGRFSGRRFGEPVLTSHSREQVVRKIADPDGRRSARRAAHAADGRLKRRSASGTTSSRGDSRRPAAVPSPSARPRHRAPVLARAPALDPATGGRIRSSGGGGSPRRARVARHADRRRPRRDPNLSRQRLCRRPDPVRLCRSSDRPLARGARCYAAARRRYRS